jgi:two-component system heavy metal sensor histidine kinase CusS
VNRVTDYLSLIAEDKGIVLEVTGDAKILGGRLLVQRAITNLVSNPVRHAAFNSKVTLAIAAEGPNVTLAVTNLGESPRPIWSGSLIAFTALIPAVRAPVGGTGLGLAIVRSIMLSHGGQVRMCSQKDGETPFTLVFPALKQSGKPRPGKVRAAGKSPSTV